MTLTHGMDTEAGRACAGDLRSGSARLQELAAQLDAALTRVEWAGPDAEAARERWRTHDRRKLDRASAYLAFFGQALEAEAAAQDDASGLGGEAGSAAVAAGTWLDGRLGGVLAGLGRTGSALLDFGGKLLDVLTGRRDHSVSSLVSSALIVAGSAAGTVLNGVQGEDRHWFDESPGHVGSPVPVATDPRDATPHHPALTPPTDVPSLMQSVTDGYDVGSAPGSTGDVRITTVHHADGTTAYVVAVPGTEAWGPSATGYVRDLTGNLHLMSGGPTAAAATVRQAMVAAGIPPGADVMLVGHSQGGIIAGTLAADPDFVSSYHVTHVLTYAAPVDHLSIDPRIRVLDIDHRLDIVPKLDLGGMGMLTSGPGQPTVTLPSPGWDPVTNHNHVLYIDSVRTALANGSAAGQVIGAYQSDPSFLRYLVGAGDTATAVDVPIDRGLGSAGPTTAGP